MIAYRPDKLLKKVAPRRRVAKLLKSDLSINQSILGHLSDMDIVPKKDLSKIALRAARQYKKAIKREVKGGSTKSEAKAEVIGEKELLVNRIENAVIHEVSQSIRETYKSEKYEWVPSDAEEPDPEHQLNYGKVFIIGEGEQPGDRYGCRCGMNILVPGEELELGENSNE